MVKSAAPTDQQEIASLVAIPTLTPMISRMIEEKLKEQPKELCMTCGKLETFIATIQCLQKALKVNEKNE